MKRSIKTYLAWGLLSMGCLVGSGAWMLQRAYQKLPDVESLQTVQLQVPLRIYTLDGTLIHEYGEKRRTPLHIEDIPEDFIWALLSTEDHRFFEHPGIDVKGLVRAAIKLVVHRKKSQGGSTITMQVARNFFLTRKKTFSRKLNEILLAIKIDRELPKEKILELYLNKIYFGKNAYGVEAAAQVYYGTSIQNLTLAQKAMLAGLPQAPSAVNPINNPQAAKKRRQHVLSRLYHHHHIREEDYLNAVSAPITAAYHPRTTEIQAPYVANWVRHQLLKRYGERIYTDGFQVYTTIDDLTQRAAHQVTKKHLLLYDKRHGYRGPLTHLDLPQKGSPTQQWLESLKNYHPPEPLHIGVVVQVGEQEMTVLLPSGALAKVTLKDMLWAKRAKNNRAVGQAPSQCSDLFQMGDVIYLEKKPNQTFQLSQVPDIEGALLAMDPYTGSIRALIGGFDFQKSHFNRATQAKRQIGSSFKPFLYATALDKGFTASSLINDAPLSFDDPTSKHGWRPQNASKTFHGFVRLREALVRSLNLVSVRLLHDIGIEPVQTLLKSLGFNPYDMPKGLSMALGTMPASLLDMAQGYSAFANGGYRITPHIIEYIADADNQIIYQQQAPFALPKEMAKALHVPVAPQVMDSAVAYVMRDILKEATQTGIKKRYLKNNRPELAGKTGSTNAFHDAWYAGFNEELVAVTWAGFDDPQPTHEYASQLTLPMGVDFFNQALNNKVILERPRPDNVLSIRINPKTGLQATAQESDGLFELFIDPHLPQKPHEETARSNQNPAHKKTSQKEVLSEHDMDNLF